MNAVCGLGLFQIQLLKPDTSTILVLGLPGSGHGSPYTARISWGCFILQHFLLCSTVLKTSSFLLHSESVML